MSVKLLLNFYKKKYYFGFYEEMIVFYPDIFKVQYSRHATFIYTVEVISKMTEHLWNKVLSMIQGEALSDTIPNNYIRKLRNVKDINNFKELD